MLVRNNGTTRWFARSCLIGPATGSSCVSEIRATSGWRAPSLRTGANCSSTVVVVITWKATSRICIATMPYAPAPCAHLCLRLPGTRPCSATSGLVLCMRAQNASSLCETCTADRWFAARGLWLVTFGLRPMAPASRIAAAVASIAAATGTAAAADLFLNPSQTLPSTRVIQISCLNMLIMLNFWTALTPRPSIQSVT